MTKVLKSAKERFITGFCNKGEIFIFDPRKGKREVMKYKGNLEERGMVTDSKYVFDPIKVITRETDNSVKMFDFRKFKEPVWSIKDLPFDNEWMGLDLN